MVVTPAAQPAGGPPVASRRRAATVSLIFSYAGVALGIVKGFVLVPFYLRCFSLAAYGGWVASGNVLSILGILDGGVSLVFSQRLATAVGSDERGRAGRVAGAGLAVIGTMASAIALAGVAISPLIGRMVNAAAADRASLGVAFGLAAIGTALTLAQSSIISIAYAMQEMAVGGTIRIVSLVVEVIVITLSLHWGAGVVALGLGSAASGAVGLALSSIYVRALWRRRGLGKVELDRGELGDMLVQTPALFFSKAAVVVLGNSDATVISWVLGPEAAGLLAINDKAFKLAQSFVNPVAGASFFGLAHLMGEGGPKRARPVVGELFETSAVISALVFPAALALNQSFVALWVGAKDVAPLPVNIGLCAVGVLVARLNLLGMVLPALGEIGRTAIYNLLELPLRLGLMIVGARELGIVGVPIAVFVSSFVVSIMALTKLLARALQTVFVEALSLQMQGIWLLGAAIAAGILGARWPRSATWVEIGLRGVILGSATCALVALGSPLARAKAASGWRKLAGRRLSGC